MHIFIKNDRDYLVRMARADALCVTRGRISALSCSTMYWGNGFDSQEVSLNQALSHYLADTDVLVNQPTGHCGYGNSPMGSRSQSSISRL